MIFHSLSPHEFFTAVVWGGLVLLLLVYIPIQVVAKVRRVRRRRKACICRICGFRFLRRDAEASCPACHARNK